VRSCVTASKHQHRFLFGLGAEPDKCLSVQRELERRSGPNCDVPYRIIRRNFSTLADLEKSKIVNALKTMKTTLNSEYRSDLDEDLNEIDYFTFFHYMSTSSTVIDYAHEGPAFPTWHRSLLLQIERAFQQVLLDPTFALPYWDWTQSDALNEEIIALFGGNGTISNNDTNCSIDGGYIAGNFSDWMPVGEHGRAIPPNCGEQTAIRRCVGCRPNVTTLPSLSAVNFALSAPSYDKWPWNSSNDCGVGTDPSCQVDLKSYGFRNALEGFMRSPTAPTLPADPKRATDLHNRVHIFLGGLMSQVPYASNDPLFWLHHTFVDLLFERWLRTHLNATEVGFLPISGAKNGHNRFDCLMPYFPFATNDELFKTSENFGYEYDFYSSSSRIGTGIFLYVAIILGIFIPQLFL